MELVLYIVLALTSNPFPATSERNSSFKWLIVDKSFHLSLRSWRSRGSAKQLRRSPRLSDDFAPFVFPGLCKQFRLVRRWLQTAVRIHRSANGERERQTDTQTGTEGTEGPKTKGTGARGCFRIITTHISRLGHCVHSEAATS